ncbi:MAG: hypothetical protein VB108_01120 [Anaerolineaceae bacterium]|nr:hypothetical protein [Anaerolineaceae bacterium]
MPDIELTYPILRMNINNQSLQFADNDILEAEVVQEIHPLSIEVPISTARVRIYTEDPRFSPFADGEFYYSLVSNMRMDLYERLDNNEHFLGRFYLEDRHNPVENSFEFVLRDAVGVLDTIPFDGMFWAVPTPVKNVIASILDPVGIPYTVDSAVGERLINGYLPGNKTVREVLQQALFAARAYASTAKSESINIKDAVLPRAGVNWPQKKYSEGKYGQLFYGPQILQGIITDTDKTMETALKQLPLVTAIQIQAHDYTEGQTEEEIYNAVLPPGDFKIIYPKSYHTVTATGVGDIPEWLTCEDGSVLVTEDSGAYPNCTIIVKHGAFEFGPNSLTLHVVPPGGQVIVKGYPWLDSTRVFYYNEAEAMHQFSTGFKFGQIKYAGAKYSKIWVESAARNEWTITDATMVSSANAPEVLSKLVEYARLRYQQEVKLFPRTDTEPGNIKLADSLYGKDIVGIVEKTVSDLTGGYLINTELVGVERKVR